MENWLKPYLNSEDIKKIEDTVASVEEKTTGEIVPMIVHGSSTIGHVPIMIYSLGLLFYYILGVPELLVKYWGDSSWFIALWAILLIPITKLLSRSTMLQRLAVSRLDREHQAQQRAMNEFYIANLNKTNESTGILLFVSIVDHQAVVLADKAIADKVSPETWDEVVKTLIGGIHSKNMAYGFCKAIEKCGDILTPHFPKEAGNQNELPNKLIIK